MIRAACLIASLFVVAAPATAQDAAMLEKGQKVFTAQKCVLCHSVAGKGNVKGALDTVGTKLTADQIRQWIVDPTTMAAKVKAERKPAMKAFKLESADLDALVVYVTTLKK